MWRFCDLHIHTAPNEQCATPFDAAAWVQSALDAGLDVAAVTDHDSADRCAAVMAAAASTSLTVVPGVELSTDRGHVLALAPGPAGADIAQELIARVGARPNDQVAFDEVTSVVGSKRRNGVPFLHHVVLIGAHVDIDGSLLGANNALSVDSQLQLARRLHALEISRVEVRDEWLSGGVKQSSLPLTLIQGSDTHDLSARRDVGTWIYLPHVDVADLRHAFAIPEACIRFSGAVERSPWQIESLTFAGGHHDGLRFEFCERTNALIGPPNSGKSLVVDAIKFVFGMTCDIAEVESVSKARSAKCMPKGTTIELKVRTPEGPRVLTRTVGGASAAAVPFKPIIFSQTELTRRGMASAPAIQLLDLHVPDVAQLKSAIDAAADAVGDQLAGLLDDADAARQLRDVVTNPQDGLEATKAELASLVGTEGVALRATEAVRVGQWREKARRSIDDWANALAVAAPDLPKRPTISNDSDFGTFLPRDELASIAADAIEKVRGDVEDARARLHAVLERDDPQLIDRQEKLQEELKKVGFEGGPEVTARIEQLRNRVGELEDLQHQLQELEGTIDAGLVVLSQLVAAAQSARAELTKARKASCRDVNESMRTFFAKIDPEGTTASLDDLIDDLKTGTRMRPETRRKVRKDLDRSTLLEQAVRRTQGVVIDESSDTDQSRIVEEAISRGRTQDLARLATLWPGDAVSLDKKGSPPTPFTELTEGLRALAIKEISFAASDLPVVTDQPEDAVPTRSVFDSLVPTLRKQRTTRQFILVSHDANIVVASDVEHVCALEAGPNGEPHSGNLFDPVIRSAALEHLEGGQAAFELRAARYEQLQDG